MDEDVTANIPFDDIPDEVLLDASGLQQFLVPMYVLSEREDAKPDFKFIGSGTLVAIEGGHHILTAAHVWNQAKDAQKVGLSLTTYASGFMVRRDRIHGQELWHRDKNSEWGPDLALLRLAPSDVARVEAHKSFLNLPQQRAHFSADPRIATGRMWAITGMVGESSAADIDAQRRVIGGHVQSRAFLL